MVLIVRVSRMMLLATLLAGFAAGNAMAQTDWRRPGAQKEAICQGSCGGGCGVCPSPRRSEGPSSTQINAAIAKASTLNNEGIAAWNRGEWGIAREKFQQAHANNPDSKVIFANLVNATHMVGQVDIEKGDWENAKNTFQSALYHVPDSKEFQRLWAMASEKVKEQRQGYDRRRVAIKLNNQGDDAWKRGDFVQALVLFQDALETDPENADAQHNVAVAQKYLKQRREVDQNNQGIEAWRNGNFATALAFWKRTLETDPENVYAREHMKMAQERFRPSGNGLIGGTSWIVGYNVPPGSNPTLRARANEMLRQQTALAGIPYNESIDFERFNFVLGIAASTTIFTDLRRRVLFDNLSNGQATPQMQSAYNSLKGRSFDELDCHSNGAMICLAALENSDITADRVVLYGPQITSESLALWQGLIQSRRVRSVQIYINQNDPVPAVAMLFGSGNALEAGANLPLFNVNAMGRVISDAAPSIGVKVFSCGGLVPTLDCHDLRVYKINRGCNRTSSGQTVPGTSLPGGRGVLEPPPPC